MAFIKGESGNPAGRPKGSGDKRRELRRLLEAHAEPLINKAVEAALNGDIQALRLCIDRLLPKLNDDYPSPIEICGVDSPEQLLEANSQICAAVFGGDLLPKEAQSLSRVLESQRKLIKLLEFEKRLVSLEQKVDAKLSPQSS